MKEVDPITSREDVKKFKENAKRMRDRVLIEIGMNTALRISDIRELKVKDINDCIHTYVKENKTDKIRKISLNDKVKVIIENYINEKGLKDDDYLFQSRKGNNKPITRQHACRILKQIAKRAGLNKYRIGTHSLRKTFGYFHYQKYKDISHLQAILNHDKPQTTLRYIGVTQEEIDKTAQELYI